MLKNVCNKASLALALLFFIEAYSVTFSGGPEEPQYLTYSALCAIAKNENRYVLEWAHYHKCIGFGKIYLYDHGSDVPLSEQLHDLVTQGFVEYIRFNGSHTKWSQADGFADNKAKFMATIQGQAYEDCIQRFSSSHRFLGFIDIDEFFVFYDQSLNGVDDVLKRYEKHAGVSFYWTLLGSGGHKKKPDEWVTRSYFNCTPRNSFRNTQFKSFVNTAFKPTMYSPHRASFHVKGNATSRSQLVDENENPISHGRNKNSSHSVASVYHYATKSKEDFLEKISRGGGAGVTRPQGYRERLDKACTEQCYEAQTLYARLCGGGISGGSGGVSEEAPPLAAGDLTASE